jgi:hypothetical protein
VTSWSDQRFGPEADYYPGSKQRPAVNASSAAHLAAEGIGPFYGIKPRVYTVKGKDVEFFTIGQLAAELGRSPVTLRKWERDGVLPKATFVAPNPKQDSRAKRRLYSRAQAVCIVLIAMEEGLLKSEGRPLISATRFTERVTALFRELQK